MTRTYKIKYIDRTGATNERYLETNNNVKFMDLIRYHCATSNTGTDNILKIELIPEEQAKKLN